MYPSGSGSGGNTNELIVKISIDYQTHIMFTFLPTASLGVYNNFSPSESSIAA